MQIIGRFMVGEYKFSGIKNIDDMEMCLEGYDNISEYPQNSGWSFTRYYFPEAFENGNSFKKDVNLIYSRFNELRKEANIKGDMEIPMQYFTLSVEQCMKMFGSCGKGNYWPSISDWDEAIMLSGYIEAEIYNSMF